MTGDRPSTPRPRCGPRSPNDEFVRLVRQRHHVPADCRDIAAKCACGTLAFLCRELADLHRMFRDPVPWQDVVPRPDPCGRPTVRYRPVHSTGGQ